MRKFATKMITLSMSAGIAGMTLATGSTTLVSAASKPTEITFWYGQAGVYEQALQSEIEAFNSSQSKYKVVATGHGDYTTLQQKITAAAKSKTLPTMSQAVYTQIADYANEGVIQNLDSLIKGKDGYSKKELNNFYSGFLKSAKYDGSYYSMPLSVSFRIMMYNKTLLKKYGVDVPKTWDDVKKLAEKTKGTGTAAAAFDQSYDMEWNSMVKAAGQSLVTSDKKVNVNSKKAIAAANLLENMVKDGSALTAGTDIYATNNFVNSKSVIAFTSSSGLASTKKAAPAGFEWGTAKLPSYKGGNATQMSGNSLVITSQASKAEAKGAFAFIKFLTSDKETASWSKATGYVPLTKKATDSKDYQAYLKENPLTNGAMDSLKYVYPDTQFVGYIEWRNDLLQATSSMISGSKTPKQALNDFAKQTKQILKEN